MRTYLIKCRTLERCDIPTRCEALDGSAYFAAHGAKRVRKAFKKGQSAIAQAIRCVFRDATTQPEAAPFVAAQHSDKSAQHPKLAPERHHPIAPRKKLNEKGGVSIESARTSLGTERTEIATEPSFRNSEVVEHLGVSVPRPPTASSELIEVCLTARKTRSQRRSGVASTAGQGPSIPDSAAQSPAVQDLLQQGPSEHRRRSIVSTPNRPRSNRPTSNWPTPKPVRGVKAKPVRTAKARPLSIRALTARQGLIAAGVQIRGPRQKSKEAKRATQPIPSKRQRRKAIKRQELPITSLFDFIFATSGAS